MRGSGLKVVSVTVKWFWKLSSVCSGLCDKYFVTFRFRLATGKIIYIHKSGIEKDQEMSMEFFSHSAVLHNSRPSTEMTLEKNIKTHKLCPESNHRDQKIWRNGFRTSPKHLFPTMRHAVAECEVSPVEGKTERSYANKPDTWSPKIGESSR